MKDKQLMYFRSLWNRGGCRWDWRCALYLACLPGIIGCATKQTPEGAEDPAPESPVPVRVARVKVTTLRPSIDLVGMIVAVPERTAVLTAQIDGRIRTVAVVEGAVVKKGDMILQLDTRQREADRLRAEALVNQQKAELDRLRHGYLPQEMEIAKQDAERARAEFDMLRLRVDAMAPLREKDEVSGVEFEKLQSMMRRDRAAYAAAKAKLDLYKAGTRPEAIAESEAKLDVANAELVRARLAVEFCTLSSPLDGIVTQFPARRGMRVSQSDRLATVVDLSQVFVRIRVPSRYLLGVNTGARVTVNVPSLPHDHLEGRITRFSGEANPDTGDVQAFATLQNAERRLKPGLGCRVRVSLPPVERALAVPVSAVADREGASVLHVVRDHKAYEVGVTIGVATRDSVQILEGLSPDDLVITEGGYGLPEGCPVETLAP